jgi:hypothetical protein
MNQLNLDQLNLDQSNLDQPNPNPIQPNPTPTQPNPTQPNPTQPNLKEINDILNRNKIDDLKKFLNKRNFLNKCNSIMMYLFYIVQSLGILATSISATNNDTQMLWIGIALNMCASIIQIYEKLNNSQMKKILIDIQAIKNGTYIDESPYIDIESGYQNIRQQNIRQQNTN